MTPPTAPSQPISANGPGTVAVVSSTEIDASCRFPLLILFLSAAIWFLVGSICGLLSSIKFHSPNFLAGSALLTYGRLRPAGLDALLYGACMQAGLGVGLWLLARLGRTLLAPRLAIIAGAIFWNLGVTIGFLGILAGDSTGFENIELPSYSVLIVFLGYLLIGISGVMLFHQRRQPLGFPSQWFLFAALFWFPWIYSTAELLLVGLPVRGVMQSVIAWWYSENLLVVWLGLVGLAAVFYFVPKLTSRPLHSHYLALFTFWMLILFGSWGGIPNTAPVPAWMPVVSTVARVLMVIPVIAVALNIHHTLAGSYSVLRKNPSLQFIGFGAAAFIVAGLMRILGTLLDIEQVLHFTWFAAARMQLYIYGFFAMAMFGAVYYIMPRLTGTGFPSAKLVRVHFWLALAGILLIALPLASGGIVEALKLQNPNIAFIDIVKSTLPFLRVSTLGDLLIALGQVVFLANLLGLVARFYRARVKVAYEVVTTDLYKSAEVKA